MKLKIKSKNVAVVNDVIEKIDRHACLLFAIKCCKMLANVLWNPLATKIVSYSTVVLYIGIIKISDFLP